MALIRNSNFPKVRKEVFDMLLQLRNKNQVTLPQDIISKLGLHKNDSMDVVLEGNKIILTPVTVVETKLLDDLKEAFDDIKNGRTKKFETLEDLFKDLDA